MDTMYELQDRAEVALVKAANADGQCDGHESTVTLHVGAAIVYALLAIAATIRDKAGS